MFLKTFNSKFSCNEVQFTDQNSKPQEQITKVARISQQHSSETVESETKNGEFDREITKERYTSLEQIQQIINDLRLI